MYLYFWLRDSKIVFLGRDKYVQHIASNFKLEHTRFIDFQSKSEPLTTPFIDEVIVGLEHN